MPFAYNALCERQEDSRMLVANAALVRRVDTAAREYLVARYSGPGNPMGAEILLDDGLVATRVPFAPRNPLMNRATGLEHVAQIDRLADFYGPSGQLFWVETTPCTPIRVLNALAACGFRIEQHASTLYAAPLPTNDRSTVDAVVVTPVERQSLDEFLDTLNAGFGLPPAALAQLRINQGFWLDVPNWHLFVARHHGRAAAAAVLSIHGEIAYLAAAATLPGFRNRGLQTALIATRIEVARALGATIVTGQAEWGGTSQANMQRAGLSISHLRTIWTNSPEGTAA
ncbi:MAG: GNAT family N-acetyltransferase [Pseudomonadales bacterium]|nr:GNAT family N-acetyltransferase [Pseudomonadales bacterium]